MTIRIMTALLLGALSLYLSPAQAAAEEGHSIDHMIESAKTPADHAAIAKEFRAKADEARDLARSHEKMGKSYGLGPVKLTQVAKAQQHCAKLSKQYGEMASEYEELAKLHEAEAKKTS